METKIPVVVLGATGAVGQRFVQLLADHPWFVIGGLAASELNCGRRYAEACRWVLRGDLPSSVSEWVVQPLDPALLKAKGAGATHPAAIAFSALPAAVARDVEPLFARAGYAVCSNASAFRYDSDVPLLIPEVNPDHLVLIERQRVERGWQGFITTNPNCTVTGIAAVLKPLDAAFGVRRVFAVSMQAVSGAGYPGVSSLDILDNVLPWISGEEEKIERETRLLLGRIVDGKRVEADVAVSAQANRVPVVDGHTVCLSLGFEQRPSVDEAVAVLAGFRGPEEVQALPSAPERPILVRHRPDRPQPRLDREAAGGMAVTVGRVRPCALLDLRLVLVVHNTLRGAANGSVLNAELLVAQGYVG